MIDADDNLKGLAVLLQHRFNGPNKEGPAVLRVSTDDHRRRNHDVRVTALPAPTVVFVSMTVTWISLALSDGHRYQEVVHDLIVEDEGDARCMDEKK